MKYSKHIEAIIEETLGSLDKVNPASPGPFFYTRVHARLTKQERNMWEKLSVLLSRPAVAIAGICLIIFINTLTVLDKQRQGPAFGEQNEQVYDEEYTMAVTSFYDFENTEP
jgi:hypothetical protein